MCAKRISSNEAATRLNCPQRTVQGWAKAGRIPGAVQLPGGQWRIPAAWVEDLVKKLNEVDGDVE